MRLSDDLDLDDVTPDDEPTRIVTLEMVSRELLDESLRLRAESDAARRQASEAMLIARGAEAYRFHIDDTLERPIPDTMRAIWGWIIFAAGLLLAGFIATGG